MFTPNIPQVAINDIGTTENFLAAIGLTMKYFNNGDIIEGIAVRVDCDEALLDISCKTESTIPSRKLSIKHGVDPDKMVEVGDEINALVLIKENEEDYPILFKKRAQCGRAWGIIEQLKENDKPVTGIVIGVVKGGLILGISLRGFLPASLVETCCVRGLQPYVSQEIETKIIEFGRNCSSVVLSRRAWLEQTQFRARSEFLHQLQKGRTHKGVVSSIVNSGTFVSLGGVGGLVYVSELSWKYIDHPSEAVQVGDEVTAEVLEVGLNHECVSLSLKTTQEDPWHIFAHTHAIGQAVPDKVTKLVPSSVFVHIEEGIEGLIRISELASRHIDVPDQIVLVDEQVMVKVIDIGLERRRISLSLRQTDEGFTEGFDPTKCDMGDSYNEQGNYIFPKGFDPEISEWMKDFRAQCTEWEARYVEAKRHYQLYTARIECHCATAAETTEAVSNHSSESGGATPAAPATSIADNAGGTLVSDEQLAVLREKLADN